MIRLVAILALSALCVATDDTYIDPTYDPTYDATYDPTYDPTYEGAPTYDDETKYEHKDDYGLPTSYGHHDHCTKVGYLIQHSAVRTSDKK